jgi:hypothetical protein
MEEDPGVCGAMEATAELFMSQGGMGGGDPVTPLLIRSPMY